jgi:hypothetical protein
LPIEFLESLHPAGSPNKPAQGVLPRVDTMKTVLRRWARDASEKKI